MNVALSPRRPAEGWCGGRRSRWRMSKPDGAHGPALSARSLAQSGWLVGEDDSGNCLASIGGRNGVIFLMNVTARRMVVETPDAVLEVLRPPRTLTGMNALVRAFLDVG